MWLRGWRSTCGREGQEMAKKNPALFIPVKVG
jgi:hypothetical protein